MLKQYHSNDLQNKAASALDNKSIMYPGLPKLFLKYVLANSINYVADEVTIRYVKGCTDGNRLY